VWFDPRWPNRSGTPAQIWVLARASRKACGYVESPVRVTRRIRIVAAIRHGHCRDSRPLVQNAFDGSRWMAGSLKTAGAFVSYPTQEHGSKRSALPATSSPPSAAQFPSLLRAYRPGEHAEDTARLHKASVQAGPKPAPAGACLTLTCPGGAG